MEYDDREKWIAPALKHELDQHEAFLFEHINDIQRLGNNGVSAWSASDRKLASAVCRIVYELANLGARQRLLWLLDGIEIEMGRKSAFED